MNHMRSVLLIEDSETQAFLLGETLKSAGIDVHRVATAEDGLDYLRSHRPSLAVVDYHLPGMQGDEFCRKLRNSSGSSGIPLMMLTDNDYVDIEQHSLDWGADDYVAKSRDPNIMLARVELLLRRIADDDSSAEAGIYQTQSILIVDDSPTYLAFLEYELKNEGYQLFLAENGEAALEIAGRSHIDCAVIDLVMPGMDGIELCRRLVATRRAGNSLPVLISTAHGSTDRMMESLEVGADDYVEKSNDSTVLKARLRALLRRKAMQEEHQRIQNEIRDKEMEFVRERARNVAHLHALLDNAADGIVSIGGDGTIRTFNRAAEGIFRVPAGKAVGQCIDTLIPDAIDDTGAVFFPDNGDEAANKGPRQVTGRRRDGIEFPAELTIGEINTDDENFYVAIIRDVTARARAEEELRAADARTHLLLDSIGEGVYGLDVEGRATFVNRSALQMLGFDEDAIIGEKVHDVLHHSYPDGLPYPDDKCPYMQTIRDGQARDGIEESFWTKSGEPLPVLLSCHPMMVRDELVGAVVSFQDLSHKKQLEEQLRQSQKMEAVGRLTGGVAHDFNNLLTVIMGNLQLLARASDGEPKTLERIDKIMGAAKSGAELTRRLLTFSRQQVLETGNVDINELVANLEDMLHRSVGETITVHTALAAEPCIGRTDANQIEHALLNLCVNARDAMPDGGQLTIETRRTTLDEHYAESRPEVTPGPYIEISVSDTGTGIPPEILGKIFDPFFTTKEKGKGTGLGLSSIFGFMKQSGGHVSVYTELGEGTTFRLYVAEADDGHETAAKDAESDHERKGQGNRNATILVVEDEESVRDVAVSMLREAGFTIIEADNGPAGLKAFTDNPDVEAVFSDVIMPGGMTGPEMVEEIQKQRPDIPVMFASGYAEQALRDRKGLLQKAKFISKPYDASKLAEFIETLLEEA